jgi:PAS domain S-box-containing protein
VAGIDAGKNSTSRLDREINGRLAPACEPPDQRDLLQAIIDALPDPVYVKDIHSRFVVINTALQRFFGAPTREEVIGRSDDDYFPPDAAASFLAEEAAILRSGRAGVSRESLVMDHRGDARWVLTTKVPLRDGSGRVLGLVGVNRDVTQQKAVERRAVVQGVVTEALAHSFTLEEAARQILPAVGQAADAAWAAVWTASPDSGRLHRAQVWRDPQEGALFEAPSRVLEVGPGTGLLGRVWETGRAAWVEDAQADRESPPSQATMNDGPRCAVAFPITNDGRVIGVAEFIQRRTCKPDPLLLPLLENVGVQIGEFVARKGAERSMRESEERKAAILRSALDCIITVDAEGKITEFNPAAERTLGYSRDQVLGRDMADMIIPARLREHHRRGLAYYLETGEGPLVGRRVEVTCLRADGSEFQAELAVTRIGVDGAQAFCGCLRDITERTESDERLRQVIAALAEREQGLQSALAGLDQSHQQQVAMQSRILQSEKMESVGRLAAGIAHEVKNPLAVVELGIEYLTKCEVADTHAPTVLMVMHGAVKRADAVIRGLLDFSVPSTLNAAPADLNAVIEQSLLLVKHALVRGHVRLNKEFSARLPLVHMDVNKIEQVFVNLFTNAVHAMSGGGTLTIRTSVDPAAMPPGDRTIGDGPAVVVADVQDTGHGIPEDALANVFDPFFTTKPPGQGTGLGLTVSKTIVELHGGTLNIRNRAEGGVLVSVRFNAHGDHHESG